jgi:thiamine transporter ThiT
MEWLSMGPASRLVGVDPDSLRRRLHSRVPATILIALGGLIPAITSGANRFGATNGFFAGELLGVLFLFAGFLVSVEVFREFRVPFTRIVVRSRRVEG